MNQLYIAFCPFELLESLSAEDRYYIANTAVDYLRSLFDQKHQGSILAELKDRRGLVDSIDSCAGIALVVHADLHANDAMSTEKIDEIVEIVFQFLRFAKRDGIQQWIHEEKNTISKIELNNMEKADALSIVKAISTTMQFHKIEYAVEPAFFDREFRPELIEQLIDHLKPENMRITLISKAFEGKTDRKEQYYGISYSYEHIAQERVDRWTKVGFNENLKLHTPNPYIPSNLGLVEREQEEHQVPVLIKQDELADVWFLQDNKFKTPRAFYGIYLKNPFSRSDPAARILMVLYCLLVNESLEEDARLAGQAGIDFTLSTAQNEMTINVHGYSQKLHIILGKILDKLVKFEPSRERFEKLKEQGIREYKNKYKQPLESLLNEYCMLLLTNRNSVEQMLDCMDRVTFEELESVPRRFFSRTFIYLFVHGNVTRADAETVENLVKQRLLDVYGTIEVPKASLITNRQTLELDDHSFCLFYHRTSEEHHQNAILSSFQVSTETSVEIAKVHLLVQLLKQQFFDKLRTEEQLGYHVSMDVHTIHEVQNIHFFIQSSYSVQHLDDRIQQFIWWAADHLSTLADEDFATYKKSLRLAWSEPIQGLTTQSFRFWNDYIKEDRDYNGWESMLKAIETTSKEDVIGLFNEHLIENPRELSIRITGTKKIAEKEIVERKFTEKKITGKKIVEKKKSRLSSKRYGLLAGLQTALSKVSRLSYWAR